MINTFPRFFVLALVGVVSILAMPVDRKALTHFQKAVRAESAGNQVEAIRFYTSAIEVDPSSGELRRRRGKIYLALKRPAEALSDLGEAVRGFKKGLNDGTGDPQPKIGADSAAPAPAASESQRAESERR